MQGMPKIWGFTLTLIVAFTTVLRTTVLHCDDLRGCERPCLSDQKCSSL